MKAVKVLAILIDGGERNIWLFNMSISCKYTSATLVLLSQRACPPLSTVLIFRLAGH